MTTISTKFQQSVDRYGYAKMAALGTGVWSAAGALGATFRYDPYAAANHCINLERTQTSEMKTCLELFNKQHLSMSAEAMHGGILAGTAMALIFLSPKLVDVANKVSLVCAKALGLKNASALPKELTTLIELTTLMLTPLMTTIAHKMLKEYVTGITSEYSLNETWEYAVATPVGLFSISCLGCVVLNRLIAPASSLSKAIEDSIADSTSLFLNSRHSKPEDIPQSA